MKVGIAGAGIAGPALAHFLLKFGHEVTLIEKASALRTGGYVIDVWGLGYSILEKMGAIDTVLKRGYKVQEVRLVDEASRKAGGFKSNVFERATGGKFVSVARGDLAAIIYDTVKDGVETIFGDEVAGLKNNEGGVDVGLKSGHERHFDMVIGSDGLHSKVRSLIWGDEETFERPLGFYVAAFRIPDYPFRDKDVYLNFAAPGCSVSRFSMRGGETLFLFVMNADQVRSDDLADDASHRRALHRIFGEQGWECRMILTKLDKAEDLYFDRVSQIEVPRWHNGRVGLIGDAAACASLLAGEGSGLGMTEAYVLAGELKKSGNDIEAALAAYDDKLRPFLLQKQTSARAFASSFAPQSKFAIWVQRLATNLMGIPMFADLFIGRTLRDDFELPDYHL